MRRLINELRSWFADELLMVVAKIYPRDSIERTEVLGFCLGFFRRRIKEGPKSINQVSE